MSEPIMLIHNNKFPDATLSGGVWTAPLTEMQDPRPGIKARSSGLTLTNTKFKIAYPSAVSFEAWAFTNTNLTEDALYRITWYSDAFVTEVSNSGWLSIPGYPTDDPDNIGAAIVHLFGATRTELYYLVEIDDQTNPDNYVEIGVGVTGECWQPPRQIGEDGNLDAPKHNTKVSEALGGTAYFNRRKPKRTFSFSLRYLDGDSMAEVRRLRKIANIDKHVFVIPMPDDPDDFNEGAFLGRMDEMSKIQRLSAGYSNTAFSITEVV